MKKTGVAPLQWADSTHAFNFLLAQAASQTTHGTGAYDCAPVELPVEKGNLEVAHTLVRRGANCPPQVADWRERQIQPRARYEKALKDIPQRLEQELKAEASLQVLAYFERIFGVPASKIRGRKGAI